MLDRYVVAWPGEAAVVERVRALVEAHADCFERTCRPGHVTGSAWVLSADRSSALLLHHRKLNRWVQPGGHADGDPDVLAVAVREVNEESGLVDLIALHDADRPTPLDIDIHTIPARYDCGGRLVEDAHEHHDIRFLLAAPDEAPPVVSAESHEVRWFTHQEIQQLTAEESVLRMQRKYLLRKD